MISDVAIVYLCYLDSIERSWLVSFANYSINYLTLANISAQKGENKKA